MALHGRYAVAHSYALTRSFMLLRFRSLESFYLVPACVRPQF